MSCNNGCNSCFRNEDTFETFSFEDSNFEGRNSRRGCRRLANDIERLIDDIRRDARQLDREFRRLEDRGCIRNTRNSSGGCDSCNSCSRCRRCD